MNKTLKGNIKNIKKLLINATDLCLLTRDIEEDMLACTKNKTTARVYTEDISDLNLLLDCIKSADSICEKIITVKKH